MIVLDPLMVIANTFKSTVSNAGFIILLITTCIFTSVTGVKLTLSVEVAVLFSFLAALNRRGRQG